MAVRYGKAHGLRCSLHWGVRFGCKVAHLARRSIRPFVSMQLAMSAMCSRTQHPERDSLRTNFYRFPHELEEAFAPLMRQIPVPAGALVSEAQRVTRYAALSRFGLLAGPLGLPASSPDDRCSSWQPSAVGPGHT